ncbi:MAG: amidohydrolase family protein [Deltaproteobacteria bacterium]|nr:amidohydrolase family protein [Deltaproteobacteria bacterium]
MSTVVIRRGAVVTMDADDRVLDADVLVRDGVIAALLAPGAPVPASSPAESAASPVTELDATGCVVLPGLVQSHVHLCQVLFRGLADDLPLLRWLRERIWPLEGAHDASSLRASAELGVAELLLGGTTTVLDMGTVHHHDVVFEVMRDAGIRGISGKTMMDVGEGVPAGLRETTAESLRESERLEARWRGAGDGRLGYAYAPRFILSCSEGLLREVAALAARSGALVHTHAAEHAEEREAVYSALGKDDVRALADCGIEGPRAVLAHCVQLRDDEIARLAQVGTRVVHCPSANLKLASGLAPVVAMRRAGIVVGIGADGAPCNNRLDALLEVREAALLAKAKLLDASALPAKDALAMATRDGATLLGLGASIGSIEPGKRADVVVVRIDSPWSEPGGDAIARVVYTCTAQDVRHVVVDGHVRVRERELLGVDLGALRDRARIEMRRVVERAGL